MSAARSSLCARGRCARWAAWLGPAVLALVLFSASSASANVELYEVAVEGFSSPFVAFSLEHALRGVPGVAAVEVDFDAGTVRAHLAPDAMTTTAQILRATESLGRPVRFVRFRARGVVRGGELAPSLLVDGRSVGRLTTGPALPALRALMAGGTRELTVFVEARRKDGPPELVVLEVEATPAEGP